VSSVCIFVFLDSIFAGKKNEIIISAERKGKNMMQESPIKKIALFACIIFLLAAGSACATADKEPSAGSVSAAAEKEKADNSIKKPLVVYYSRTGNARMVATALGNHLDAEVVEMQSEKDRGIFTIIGEQYFWGGDKQKPLEKNLQDYSPIIVVAPIYLMKLSAPGRLFIEEAIPEGSQVYVFTTSGGPLAGSTQKSITELVTESGLVAKGVYGFQAGKTQEEIDKAVSSFLKEHQLIAAPPAQSGTSIKEPAGDTEEGT
jgi:flavodoxin